MTATKILTDSLATGLISAEILATIDFVETRPLGVVIVRIVVRCGCGLEFALK